MDEKQINLFPLLTAKGEAEINTRADKNKKEILTPEGLKQYMIWNHLKFDKNAEKRCLNHNERKRLKDLRELREKVFNICGAKDFGGDLVISVEWRTSRMWRANPKAFTNYGFTGSSIGGCGYDKQSTAVAEALNSHLPLIKLMCAKKEEILKKHKGEKHTREYREDDGAKITRKELKSDHDLTREYLGYGSGYSIIPYFEGGVGTGSHESICRNIGLEMRHVSNMKSSDVFIVEKKVQE